MPLLVLELRADFGFEFVLRRLQADAGVGLSIEQRGILFERLPRLKGHVVQPLSATRSLVDMPTVQRILRERDVPQYRIHPTGL